MRFKKITGKIHLWLGMLTGLLVFIIAITGCLYVFREEIENMTQPYRFVQEQEKNFLPPSAIQDIAQKQLPGKHVHAILYTGKSHAAKAIFYADGEESYYYFVYVNPYTGEVLKVSNENEGFFPFILDGHFYLWLPHHIGQPVVAVATLVFFVMVVTGIVLWWPRNKAARKQRFGIKRGTRWRRKNYDLHNVLGFYVSWIAVIFIVTGLVWGFQWFMNGYYAVMSGGESMVPYEEPLSAYRPADSTQAPAIDRVFAFMQKNYPAGHAIEIHIPEERLSCIAANANPDPSTYWQTDYRYFDRYSLQELDVKHVWGRMHRTGFAQKLIRMNYDIHVGSIGGLPGKILAFFASLIIASLPVTGFMIWWGRRKKSRAARPEPAEAVNEKQTLAV